MHDTWRSGFEFHRRVGPGYLVLVHFADHVPAPDKGTHFVHPLATHVDRARARGPVEFVTCDGVEITTDILDVDRHVDGGL